MLSPTRLKELIEASFTKDGIYYKKNGDSNWLLFNHNSAIQIGERGYEWVEFKYLPKPQHKGEMIGAIGNSYGSLRLRKHDTNWQWGVSDYDGEIDFKTIPNYLAEALLRYEKERDK